MRVFKIMLTGIIMSVFFVGQAYSNHNENHGSGNEHGNQGQQNDNRGNNGNNGNHGQNVSQSSHNTQQARRSAENDRRRQERNNQTNHNPLSNESRDNNNANPTLINRSQGHGVENRNDRAHQINEMLAAFDRARWNANPHDNRGQGNAAVVGMRDPFGFEKDPDRLGAERGRPFGDSGDVQVPIDEDPPVLPEDLIFDDPILDEIISLNLEEDLLFEWETENAMVETYQRMIDYYNSVIASGSLTESQVYWYNYYISYYEGRIAYYESLTYERIYLRGDATIDYSINLDIPEDFEETTLLVQTSLVVSESFSTFVRTYNSETGTWEYTEVFYEAGQVIAVVEEEVLVNADSSLYEFSYDPPGDLLEGNEWNYEGGYFDLVINVTDTSTESSFTQSFDKSLYLYRDPYGKVEDSVTGEAIVGVKITVFTEDGSIVALDKASNPTASNPQITDATGRFGFNLRADRKYYMVASAPGYEDYQSQVFTEQFHVIREDISLIPKQEKLAVSDVK